ncbi:hypothetical protein JCM6882_002628 [Rhodosporidiobolus microsporus]
MASEPAPYPAHHLRPSTSRTSLEDLAAQDQAERYSSHKKRGDKHDGRAATGPGVAVPPPAGTSPATVKGKEKAWSVELAVVGADGARRVLSRKEVAGDSDAHTEGAECTCGGSTDVDEDAQGTPARPPSEDAHLPGPPASPSLSPSTPLPPPSPETPQRPERPPLQSILRRPELARTPSSVPSQLSFSTSLSPLPTSHGAPASPTALPLALDSPTTPDSVESKLPGVVFSSTGTHSTVVPLSTPSVAAAGGDSAETRSSSGFDPAATIRSWKSSVLGRRSGNIDKKRLASLGFEEELHRDYDFWASWGISMCNIGALPGTTLGVLTAFRTGGGSMYSIAWPISGLFLIGVAALLGEMASTWPVAGASFTWVFRLCRSKRRLDPWARYMSWVTGSILLCSHILLQIVITWQFAHNLLGVITLFTGDHYSHWVTVGIGWGICLLSGLVVSSRISRSPWLWRICGGLIVVFFLTINITILAQADTIRSAKYVFTSYNNETGFTSRSYVYMLGWVLTCVATGMEASAHMAEDTKRPARTVPLAMFWSTAVSYLLGWMSICVLLSTMQRDGIDSNLQPSIALIANSIPRSYTTLILVFVLLSFLFQAIAQLLATSRFIFALARESALPFSNFFRRLSKNNRQPTAAIWGTLAVAVPTLCFLAIDSSIISTIILEGAGITATSAYVIPIIIYLFCKRDVLRGDGRAQWTLRGASKIVALPVSLFLLTFIIMMCLPTGYPVTALNASYASAVFAGVLLLSSIAWIFYGNGHYAGPIKTTTRWTIGAEVDLPSSSSNGETQRNKKKSTAAGGAHVTTSAAHGRSAHVWVTSTNGSSGGGGGGTSVTREYGSARHRERGDETEMTGVTTGRTSGFTSGTGSEWTEYTEDGSEGSYETDEEGDEEEDEETRSRRGAALDEERSVRGGGEAGAHAA